MKFLFHPVLTNDILIKVTSEGKHTLEPTTGLKVIVEALINRDMDSGSLNSKWNLSYTDPMGLALVCIIYSGTLVIQTLWD